MYLVEILIKKENLKSIIPLTSQTKKNALLLEDLPRFIDSLFNVESGTVPGAVQTSSLEDFASGTILKINREDGLLPEVQNQASNLTSLRPRVVKSEQ